MKNTMGMRNLLLMVEENKYQDFADRLNALMTKKDIKIGELQKVSGVSYEMARRYTLGIAKPRQDKMLKMANYFDVSVAFLDHGVGDERREREPVDLITYRVEVLDVHASAGPGVVILGDFIETVTAIEYTTEQARILFGGRPQEVIKVITIDGDSMQGTIDPGDQVFVDTSINSLSGDGIYIFVYGDTLHIKRLQMQGERLAVLSDNKKYETWYLDNTNEYKLHIMAKVLLGQSIKYLY
ncbi:LexA family transcriptional regulator [Symbiopectobacterium sp.]|uniref:LexA family transcriptional regulator n=1 Tax=Symbiopectobacterium sp. TaxID=2952789 RepID=UPI003F29FFAC